jgi:hypothetical protein
MTPRHPDRHASPYNSRWPFSGDHNQLSTYHKEIIVGRGLADPQEQLKEGEAEANLGEPHLFPPASFQVKNPNTKDR